MTAAFHLSSKLPLVSQRGFALHHSRQPHYEREWHTHDCTMLLWPRTGGLKSAWLDADAAAHPTGTAHASRTLLSRHTALLLPGDTAHHTVSGTAKQQHGELYFAPELIRGDTAARALQLDGATVAMLDALLAPALDDRAAEHLVRAIAGQLLSSRPLTLAPLPGSLGQRTLRVFARALDDERPLPSVDDAACELGMSTRQLQRACQQEFGASPVALRRRLLAMHARALLAEGLAPAAVSLRLGFASSGHLGRLLRGVPD